MPKQDSSGQLSGAAHHAASGSYIQAVTWHVGKTFNQRLATEPVEKEGADYLISNSLATPVKTAS